MILLLLAIGLLLVSGLWALKERRCARGATRYGVGGAVLGGIVGLIPVIQNLIHGGEEALRFNWNMPFGSFAIQLDPLASFFLLPILGLSALSAIYGGEYLLAWREKKSLGGAWFSFNLLVASMVMVVIARNAVLFLVAWELMALSSFFLVTFESEKAAVREAGWTYLVATHIGTAFILAMFVILGVRAGSFDFDAFGRVAELPASVAALLFLFAVIGFGTKAGFMPFHVWLPEAHPAAPSHVSAVMSGVMIKTGIYSLVRMLAFFGPPPIWWGWVLVGIGFTSGVLGVLFALAQHDLKRLLAYHSVENIGIIALGLGVGLLGVSADMPVLMVLGFGGGLLHVLNHAIFKGLLFLGAGAVLHSTGTRELDHLGGLLKRMRWTGAAFLVGAVAISGLPPLNGFVSEFLIYLGSLNGCAGAGVPVAVSGLAVIAALALIGGLAAACFTKAFGVVFLGEPRSEHAVHAHEVGWAMRLPMIVLAASCILIGLLAPAVVRAMIPVIGNVAPLYPNEIEKILDPSSVPLIGIVLVFAGFLVLLALLIGLRRFLLAGRPVGESGTWDCGYAKPTARMQYTSSSYAQPLTDLFSAFLRTRRRVARPEGILPTQAALATETPDTFLECLFRPVFAGTARALAYLRRAQHGHVQTYVLYVALTLVALLVWYLGWKR